MKTMILLAGFFLSTRSTAGILLVSILIYWMEIPLSAVFLEFPYQAIPFWTFLGMLLAHKKQLEQHL